MAFLFSRRSSSSAKHQTAHRPSHARSSSSVFSSSNARSSSSSYYKRRPRDSYVARLMYKLKHLLRELWYYLRRNPVKTFVFIIMPLISGGVLASFARQFGVQLPAFLSGKSARQVERQFSGGGGGYYGSRGYGHDDGPSSAVTDLFGGDNFGSALKLVKAFL